jgi:exopolysaccharide biosynthesis WecB/TagA/CpsF family protein
MAETGPESRLGKRPMIGRNLCGGRGGPCLGATGGGFRGSGVREDRAAFAFGGETIRIRHADRDSLLADVEARNRAGEGFAIATLNLDHMVKLRASAEFRAAYRRHEFVVAAGNAVIWLSRLAGRPVQLVAGADLVVPLARLAAEAHGPVALAGSTGDALDGAVVALRRIVPGLGVTRMHAPEMNFDPDGPDGLAVLAEIADSGAGLAFLALGAVRQERLAARGRRHLPHGSGGRWPIACGLPARATAARGQATSKRAAAPMPPPMHMETTTWRTPRRRPSISAWPTSRAPVMP